MKSTTSPFRRKPVLIAALVVAAFVLAAAGKIFEYSAPPAKPKDCNFIYPPNADQTKPTMFAMPAAPARFQFFQLGGTINDASCLNKTAIYGIAKIQSAEDIQNALQFARENHLKVTPAGQRHSMGGQSFVQNGIVLDMRGFNQLKLDKERKILTAQTGATWKQIQLFLDPQGLAVKAMQSINIFSVGGTLSVNAHGIAHDPGQVAPTVRSFHILLSNGEIQTASPTENPELFRLALGGYGLMGVILDVDLDVVNNEMYVRKSVYMDYHDFPAYYEKHVEGNEQIGLTYGRVSISPNSYLTETALHTYEKTNYAEALPRLTPPGYVGFDRFVINFSKTGGFGRWFRWQLEKHVEPRLHPCLTRNTAMSREEGCLVTRNEEMYDSMDYLENRLKDTDILQEYFIPRAKMPEFLDGLREIVRRDGSNLLNVTIRIVHKDTITALPYATQEMFAYVLYFNQRFNERDSRALQKTTVDLIDLTLRLKGTYYLPYQLFYSPAQLRHAYPGVDNFFEAKKNYDPTGLFTNKFYEKFGE
jgi:FAD/FMN-containing dehydrogenase